MKKTIALFLLLFCMLPAQAMTASEWWKAFFSSPEHFSKEKNTNTVVTPSNDPAFERGRAKELRPDISVPPTAQTPTNTSSDSTQTAIDNTLVDKQKFEDLITGLEKIASFGDSKTPAHTGSDIIPVQTFRPANAAQKIKWLPPPPGFMTADTYNYLIYRQEQPVTPALKTVLDTIHGNLMLDLTPFTLVLKPNKILVMLFNQRQSYMQYTHRPAWSGASSDLQSDSVYVVEEPGFYPLTVHELTHLYFDGYFLPTLSPLWLSEGMAVYMQILASRERPSWVNESLQQIVQDGQVIPFEEMMAAETLEKYSDDAAALWYTQAYSVIDYLLNNRSRDEFYRFCNELKNNSPVYLALYRAYGMPFNKVSVLQNVWLHYLQKAYQEGRLSEATTPEPLKGTTDNLNNAQAIATAQKIILGDSPAKAPVAAPTVPTQTPSQGLQAPRPVLHRPAPQKTQINKLKRVEPNADGGYW